jgi:hypothetical protein
MVAASLPAEIGRALSMAFAMFWEILPIPPPGHSAIVV